MHHHTDVHESTENVTLPHMMIDISPIPAFQDNYIWLISNGTHAVVVDPGDAAPVMDYLQQHRLSLDTILITHHHADHIGGVSTLLNHFPAKVYAPKKEHYEFPHQAVIDQQQVKLANLGLTLQVLEVPGHTLGHVAYYGANSLFCGDTLFGAGCGRLFEGTPEQMFTSLQKIAAMPKETNVYCAHEYTLHNLNFAYSVEPHNTDLINRIEATKALRENEIPSLPSSINLELATNPFLRCHSPEISKNLGLANTASSQAELIQVFTLLRQMRNQF